MGPPRRLREERVLHSPARLWADESFPPGVLLNALSGGSSLREQMLAHQTLVVANEFLNASCDSPHMRADRSRLPLQVLANPLDLALEVAPARPGAGLGRHGRRVVRRSHSLYAPVPALTITADASF